MRAPGILGRKRVLSRAGESKVDVHCSVGGNLYYWHYDSIHWNEASWLSRTCAALGSPAAPALNNQMVGSTPGESNSSSILSTCRRMHLLNIAIHKINPFRHESIESFQTLLNTRKVTFIKNVGI